MKRECPGCGKEWTLNDKRRKELVKYSFLSMHCKKCGKAYELQKISDSIYVRYSDGNGSVRERIGTAKELAWEVSSEQTR